MQVKIIKGKIVKVMNKWIKYQLKKKYTLLSNLKRKFPNLFIRSNIILNGIMMNKINLTLLI